MNKKTEKALEVRAEAIVKKVVEYLEAGLKIKELNKLITLDLKITYLEGKLDEVI